MSQNSPRPTKAQQRDDARAQALKVREEQKKREKRNRFVALGVLLVAVVALVWVVIYILGQQDDTRNIAWQGDPEITLADATGPAPADDRARMPMGPDLVPGSDAGEDAVSVEIIYDYECPYCADFESANGDDVEFLLESGDVTVFFRPISFLDGNTPNQYSTRVGNAAAVVADEAPEQFLAFHHALYADRLVNNARIDDDRIAEIALEVGVPQAVIDQFTATVNDAGERLFSKWQRAATNLVASELGGLSTPTVLINGQKFEGDLYNQGPFAAAVMEAVANADS